jgi:hypothetical protein
MGDAQSVPSPATLAEKLSSSAFIYRRMMCAFDKAGNADLCSEELTWGGMA